MKSVASEASEFLKKLKAWQKSKNFTAKEAADFLGVKITTYRHWMYDGATPSGSKCLTCIENLIKL